MAASSCVARLGPGVAAYNSAVGSKSLCQALADAGIAMPCPPTPADLNALDRKVLCAIFCCCLREPNLTSGGHRRYQNCVAATLKAGQHGDVNAPAYHMNPEVSYTMKTDPPTPVGKYFSKEALQAATKTEWEAATGLRRPDVVVRRPGANGGLSGDVIQKVWEMKFPGDSYGPGQRKAYVDIAGGEKRFDDLDEDKCCTRDDDKQGERLMQAVREARDAKAGQLLKGLGAAALGLGALGALGGLGGLLGAGLAGLAAAQ